MKNIRKKLLSWKGAGILTVAVTGTLLHFVYDWTGKNQVAGYFAPVNESSWEHLKLLFIPFLLFSVVEFFGRRQQKNLNYLPAKVIGVLFGMAVIIGLFYTYVGVLGFHMLWADILVYFLGVIAAFQYSERRLAGPPAGEGGLVIGITLLAILIVCFLVFTRNPPHIGLFLDPITKGFGMNP